MNFQIKSWVTGKVLFEADTKSLKFCVELAVRKGISLNYAELNYAELNDAELNGAKLNDAKLNDAKLNDAKLNYAELNDAKLNYAELNGAELNYAKLNYAELNDAELNGAKLNDAKLNGAKLNDAKLNGADLIRIDGLRFSVIISRSHIHIGCKRFTHKYFREINLSKQGQSNDILAQFPIVISMLDAIQKYKEKNNHE